MADITFVDANDTVIGFGTKQEAWDNGIIHRIVRIFVFNSKGELLIQKRGATLASNPNKWDQSAAGHVDAGEDYLTAANRELKEEIGVESPLTEKGKYFQDENDEPGKQKKRFNMLYTTIYDGEVSIDPREVQETRWVQPEALEVWMQEHPEEFTKGHMEAFRKIRAMS
jgi:isopentenyl-diphosphate delta-isomerase